MSYYNVDDSYDSEDNFDKEKLMKFYNSESTKFWMNIQSEKLKLINNKIQRTNQSKRYWLAFFYLLVIIYMYKIREIKDLD